MVDNNERHREQAEADGNGVQLVVSDHFGGTVTDKMLVNQALVSKL